MSDFKAGDRAVYDEDGNYTLVEVLEIHSNEDQEAYRLQAVRALSEFTHGLCLDAEPGEEWTCSRTRNCAYGGMWHLRSVEEFGRTHPDVDLT